MFILYRLHYREQRRGLLARHVEACVGSAPAGLKMATSYGIQSTVVFGTPTMAQTRAFTVQVQDSAGETATKPFSITIDSAASIGDHQPNPTTRDRRDLVLRQPLCQWRVPPLHLVDYGGTAASRSRANQRVKWGDHHQRHSHYDGDFQVYRDRNGQLRHACLPAVQHHGQLTGPGKVLPWQGFPGTAGSPRTTLLRRGGHTHKR